MKKKIVAMVPIKLNNERLPNKNTKDLGGIPLISYILHTLLQVEEIDDIYVFCSSEDVVPYLPNGVQFLRRDTELDKPTANFTQFFEAFMSDIYADVYVFTHATAPFLRVKTISDCINKVINESYDSSFTASKLQDFLWMNNKPMNFDASNLPRSQDLEPIYRETSGVYVFERNVIVDNRRRIGANPFIAEISAKEATDINVFEDFELAEAIVGQNRMNRTLNLIFDLDGVLIDSSQVQESAFYGSYNEVVGDNNCPDFSEYMKHTGDSLPNIFQKMGLPQEMVIPYRRISSEAIWEISVNWEIISYLRELCMIGAHINFAICTGKDHKRTQDILDHFHISDLFDAVICSDDVEHPKPDAEPTLRAMNALNGDNQNTILIGDGYNDILSAKNADITSILTTWYGDMGVPQEANYLVKNAFQFRNVIGAIFNGINV